MNYKRVLSIAGSDPSGGAGLQADLKTFSALGCYGMTAVTAVVDENTVGVTGVHPIPVEFVTGQIRSCLDDIGADAVKIGMLHDSELIRGVCDTLDRYDIPSGIVVDPVMVATSGDQLLEPEAIATLRESLLPRARIITPNIPEAEILSGASIRDDDVMEEVAYTLHRLYGVSVLLKGGHLQGKGMTDVLYDAETGKVMRITSPRYETVNTHGTGCTLSSAIASFLAHGHTLADAVTYAISYISEAIRHGACYRIGHGHGPVHHFHALWPREGEK